MTGVSEILIHCENVSKRFCRDLRRSLLYGVQDIAKEPFDRKPPNTCAADVPLRRGEFWANHDICFELRRGDRCGLIGRNGSGKTTFLKLLNGLIRPDSGRIELRGRVAALIALGAGFNPILTGRENILVNGMILGLSRRQIADRIEEILDFAELSSFADSPVRNYSSGMQVRLGFAVAAVMIEPDVLLLDEVLAVGDMGFRVKCLNRIRELSADTAVVLVSHSMPQIGSFCSRVCLLEQGSVAAVSDNVADVVSRYETLFDDPSDLRFFGSGDARLTSHELQPVDGIVDAGDPRSTLQLTLEIEFDRDLPANLFLLVKTASDEPLLQVPLVDDHGAPISCGRGRHRMTAALPVGDLSVGRYRIHLVVEQANEIILRIDNVSQFLVVGSSPKWAKVVRAATTECRKV